MDKLQIFLVTWIVFCAIVIGLTYYFNKKKINMNTDYEKHGYEYYNETYNSTEVPESTREELIIKLIENLKSSWEPKTKKRDGYGYHGSNKGDYLEYTVYFNPYEADWTTDEDQAFKGYIFKHISDVMFDIKIKKR